MVGIDYVSMLLFQVLQVDLLCEVIFRLVCLVFLVMCRLIMILIISRMIVVIIVDYSMVRLMLIICIYIWWVIFRLVLVLFSDCVLNMLVRIVLMMLLILCILNMLVVLFIFSRCLRLVMFYMQIMLVMKLIMIVLSGLMVLQVGVMLIRLVIVFDVVFSVDGLFLLIVFIRVQLSMVVVVVSMVLRKVSEVIVLVVVVELVLKLNQFIYSSMVLMQVNGMLCGFSVVWLQFRCLLMNYVLIRLVMFVLMWIMVLLVKLIVFSLFRQLLFQMMCVIGMQLRVNYSVENSSIVWNLMCLVKVLMISVVVMLVKVDWKVMNRQFGRFLIGVLFIELGVKFLRKVNLVNELKNGLFVLNIVLQLQDIYSSSISENIIRIWLSIDSIFFECISLLQNRVRFGIIISSISNVEVSIQVMLL